MKTFSECEKNILILLLREKKLYLTQISQKLKMTYSHVVKIINRFKFMKIVSLVETKRRRERVYVLTDLGKKISMEVMNINNIEERINNLINAHSTG